MLCWRNIQNLQPPYPTLPHPALSHNFGDLRSQGPEVFPKWLCSWPIKSPGQPPEGGRTMPFTGPVSSCALTGGIQHLCAGHCPPDIIPHLCSATVLAFKKKGGCLQHIGVEEVLRRFTSKCLSHFAHQRPLKPSPHSSWELV